MKKPRQRRQRNYSQEYEKSLENYGMYNNIWLWVTMKCNNKNANTEQSRNYNFIDNKASQMKR